MNNTLLGKALGGALVLSLSLPGTAAAERYHGFQGEGPGYIPFLDSRELTIQPLASQLQAAAESPATIRWNQHGTPKVIFNRNGYLSQPRDGEPVAIAREFLAANATLMGQSLAMIDAMEVLRVSPLHESPDYARMLRGEEVSTTNVPHVVLFRQVWDGVSAGGRDGLVTVGVARDGRVAFVGSTLSRETQISGVASLSMIQALQLSASNVEMNLGALELTASPENDFNTFSSDLLDDVQRVRLRALPVPGKGVRRVYETTLLDTSHERGHPQAFIIHLDAETGEVYTRDNQVQHLSDARYSAKVSVGQISGTTAESACGMRHPIAIDAGNDVLQVTVQATSAEDNGSLTGNSEPADITLNLYYLGIQVASQDLLGSPETLIYQPAGGVPEGEYEVEVCPFNNPAPPIDYVGSYTATPGVAAGGATSTPAWKVFPNSPVPARFAADGAVVGEDIRENWCWDITQPDSVDDNDLGRPAEQCDRFQLRNVASRSPWDALADGTPTFTTQGNNASTAVSNVNFVAPDTVAIRPVAEDRTYDFAFTNAWFESQCNPQTYVDPTWNMNDYEAATVNLFAMHNRMHDWSYMLGWTEVNSNLQLSNYGLTSPIRQNDPELGSSQAGRATLNGRDNANQLTLQDGVPGVTNQYLWQALPAAIYPAGCVDGAYDMAIIGHEYTHATSNRMTGGPDASLGGGQAGSMGEAWSDLAAIEYLQSYGLVPIGKENPFAMAVYTTGDPESAIRNYAINKSPLHYGNLDYDGNGAGSPHANSEIWGAANYQVRQALIDKYEAQFSFEDKQLQADCADGKVSSTACPGNRRWVQMLYDGLLLQPASPTMLDARDAMLASDLLRYDGANQAEMWDAFAYRGMGAEAFAESVDDLNAIADFASPLRGDNAVINFNVTATDGSKPLAQVHVGHYEARVTPVADTDPATELGTSMRFVPGDYTFLVRADGYGHHRFKRTITAGQNTTMSFNIRPNLASVFQGAVATGDGDTPEDLVELIDDSENTNWASTDGTGTASEGKGEGAFVEGRQVTVQLAERSTIRDVNVSAVLNPDSENQNRFTALRSFDLMTCDASTGANCANDAGFTPWYSSADDAFNGRYLRPKSPHLILRAFDVEPVTATHVRIVVRDNQCTGGPDFQREANPSGDPTNDADCDTGSNVQLTALALPDAPAERGQQVHITELQVFADKVSAGSGELRDPDADLGTNGFDAIDPSNPQQPDSNTPDTGGDPIVVRSDRGGALGWLLIGLGLLGLARRRG